MPIFRLIVGKQAQPDSELKEAVANEVMEGFLLNNQWNLTTVNICSSLIIKTRLHRLLTRTRPNFFALYNAKKYVKVCLNIRSRTLLRK
jgi:hypothetical protein